MTKEGSEAHPGKEKRFRTIEGWIREKKRHLEQVRLEREREREREGGGREGGREKESIPRNPQFLRQSN